MKNPIVALSPPAEDRVIPTAECEAPPDELVDEQTQFREIPGNPLRGTHDRGSITHRATLKGFGRRGVIEDAPLFGEDDIPPGVVVGREGLPHPRRPIAEPNIAVAATRITKLGKAPIFLGDQEIRWEDELVIIHDSTA